MGDTSRTITIYINGKEVENSVKNISTAIAQANAETKKWQIGTEEYEVAAVKLAQYKAVLADHNAHVKELQQSWQDATEKTSMFSQMLNSTKEKMVEWGGVVAGAFSITAIAGFFKSSTEYSLKLRDSEQLLLVATKGRYDIQQKLLKQTEELAKTTIYKPEDIINSQKFLVEQGRSEEQIKKTMQAAADLSAVTGGTLNESMMILDGTMEGKMGKGLLKLDIGLKDLSITQLQNGEAIDLVEKKYAGLAEAMTTTTQGKLIMAEKNWDEFKKTVGDFSLLLIDKLLPAFTSAINGLKSFGGWLEDNSTIVISVGKAVGVLTMALASYATTTLLVNTYTKVAIAVKTTFATVMKVVRGEIALAEIAQKAFNTTMKLNPIGLAVAAITAAVTAYELYKNKISETVVLENKLKDVRLSIAKSVGEESAGMSDIFEKLKKTNAGTAERKSLIEQINPILEKYHINLLNESSSLTDIKNAQEGANEALYKGIILDKQKSQIGDLEGKRLENQLKLNDALAVEEKYNSVTNTAAATANRRANKNWQDEFFAATEAKVAARKEIATVVAEEDKLNAFFDGELAKYNKKTYEDVKALKDMTLEELEAEKGRIEALGDDMGKANSTRLQSIKTYIAAKEKAQDNANAKEESNYDKLVKKSMTQETDMALYISEVKDKIATDSAGANAKELKDIEDKYEEEITKLKKFQVENQQLIIEAQNQLTSMKGQEKTKEYKTLQAHILELAKLSADAGNAECTITNEKDNAIAAAVEKQHATQLEKLKTYLAKVAELNGVSINEELNTLNNKHEKELKELTKEYEENKGYFDDELKAYNDYLSAKTNLTEQYENEKANLLNLQRINSEYGPQLAAAKGNAEKEYKIKSDELTAEITAIKGNDEKTLELKKKLQNDLDALNADHVKKRRDIELQTAETVANALFEIEDNILKRKLDATTNELEEQRKSELANTNLTQQQIDDINQKYDDQEKQLKNEENQKEFNISLEKAIADGALAVIKAYADSGPYGAAAAGIAVLAEIAVIESNPPSQYESGGYTNGDKIYRAGEKGKEYIAPAYQVNDPVTGPLIADLERMRTGKQPKYISSKPIMPNFEAMQAVSTAYTSYGRNIANNSNTFAPNANKFTSGASSISDKKIDELISHFESLSIYMKDPKNRRAMVVRDELTRYDLETNILKGLSQI